eukprot:987801_1
MLFFCVVLISLQNALALGIIKSSGYPFKVSPIEDQTIDRVFRTSDNVSELQSKHYNQPLFEPGYPVDWRLWTALVVSNEPLALDMIKTYGDQLSQHNMSTAVGLYQGVFESVLNIAIRKRYNTVVQALLDPTYVYLDVNEGQYQTGPGPNDTVKGTGMIPLFAAVRARNAEALRLLLKHPEIKINFNIAPYTSEAMNEPNLNVIEFAKRRNMTDMVQVFHDVMCGWVTNATPSEKEKRKEFILYMPFEGKCGEMQHLPYANVKRSEHSFLMVMGVAAICAGIAVLVFVCYRCQTKKNSNETPSSDSE